MNPNWKNFLTVYGALNTTDVSALGAGVHKLLCPVMQLGVLTVVGKDAASFLQGQITCNVNDITESKSSLGAICNPKGRVITTFLLVKHEDTFLLVLPLELLASVKKRLQMYVLRSAVTLTDSSDDCCLIGLCSLGAETATSEQFGHTSQQQHRLTIDLSRKINRQLLMTTFEDAQSFWNKQISEHGYQPTDPEVWRSLDILDGIPWLSTETSEEYIPQMLNLDTLGGISFTKGCYTGQEIVARTHYLGKTKRQLFVAESSLADLPEVNATIIDDSSGMEQPVGNVLQAQVWQNRCRMLLVLQVSETQTYQLKLEGKEVRLLSVD